MLRPYFGLKTENYISLTCRGPWMQSRKPVGSWLVTQSHDCAAFQEGAIVILGGAHIQTISVCTFSVIDSIQFNFICIALNQIHRRVNK